MDDLMLDTTCRFLEMAWRLGEAGVRYGLELDPEFAILMSFEDARGFYRDLLTCSPMEVHYYIGASPVPVTRPRRVYYPNLEPPPYPDGKRVVWATIEGIRIAIKGREDA